MLISSNLLETEGGAKSMGAQYYERSAFDM